ncbi:MAG: energy transducer TonB [Pyrinomonadaceae bacterium]|nr:energy transducer TonB [Pyrinomonadaceae bacterium]
MVLRRLSQAGAGSFSDRRQSARCMKASLSSLIPQSTATRYAVSAGFIFALLFLCMSATLSTARTAVRKTSVAVLDFGETETGRRAADRVWQTLRSSDGLELSDREEARAAARGSGYAGSLNMTLAEARELGATIGADFFITGDAQTLRRSPSEGDVYFEAYASIFLVSSRTGRLIMWERPSFQASTPEAATERLMKELAGLDVRQRYSVAIARALEDEMRMRALAVGRTAPLIEEAPDDAKAASAEGLRLPLPYRRLRPPYPETARRAEAQATVDVEADIGADGEVSRVEVVRWAGFGLDEATADTVRQMHFRPAMRKGEAIPMRVLLRYNFRKPPVESNK